MKRNKLALAIIVAGAASITLVGCNDDSDRPASYRTNVAVFDGHAVGCTVTINGGEFTAEANTNVAGQYTFRTVGERIPSGSVVTATGCIDADTRAPLPSFLGVTQGSGAVASPFSTLAVAAAQAAGGDPANLSQAAIDEAATRIAERLGLGKYNPINPKSANYVSNVGSSAQSQALMTTAMALSTLILAIEKSGSPSTASAAVSAITQALLNSENPVDLKTTAGVQAFLASAASGANNAVVGGILNTTSGAVAEKIAQIAASPTPGAAGAIAQKLGQVLSDPESTIDDVGSTPTENLPPINVGTTPKPDDVITGGTGSSN
ncbi:Hypothetical protein HDN1F_10540 [gamma proteobacterium HdN1]|nr:Hypothetical protein HDN1F_10540 [gamma proteobacterium HdN1]